MDRELHPAPCLLAGIPSLLLLPSLCISKKSLAIKTHYLSIHAKPLHPLRIRIFGLGFSSHCPSHATPRQSVIVRSAGIFPPCVLFGLFWPFPSRLVNGKNKSHLLVQALSLSSELGGLLGPPFKAWIGL